MKAKKEVIGMITFPSIPTLQQQKLIGKLATCRDGSQYKIVSITRLRRHIEKRATSAQHWQYFLTGLLAN